MSMDLGNFGIGIQHEVAEAIGTAHALGADVVKIRTDLPRLRPRAGSRFHTAVIPYLQQTVDRLKQVAPKAEACGIKLAIENH